jgi:hypothetical protein
MAMQHPTAEQASKWTWDEWYAYYETLSMKELKRVVGESMGMSTTGTREQLLKSIRDRHEARTAK